MGDRCACTACPHPSSCMWSAVKALCSNWDESTEVRWCYATHLLYIVVFTATVDRLRTYG